MKDKFENRILDREHLKRLSEEGIGQRVVFTNGCFDLIHAGHVRLINEARSMGDLLVVGINSDESVSRLKGPSRPLITDNDRAYILLNFRAVDYVTIFAEDTPLEVIKALRPDVLVKGAEYEKGDIVGADFVESAGGRVVRVDMFEGRSTSAIIERIKADP